MSQTTKALRKALTLLVIAAAVPVVTGCGGSSSPAPASSKPGTTATAGGGPTIAAPAQEVDASPAVQAYRAYIMAVYAKDARTACSLLSPEAQQAILEKDDTTRSCVVYARTFMDTSLQLPGIAPTFFDPDRPVERCDEYGCSHRVRSTKPGDKSYVTQLKSLPLKADPIPPGIIKQAQAPAGEYVQVSDPSGPIAVLRKESGKWRIVDPSDGLEDRRMNARTVMTACLDRSYRKIAPALIDMTDMPDEEGAPGFLGTMFASLDPERSIPATEFRFERTEVGGGDAVETYVFSDASEADAVVRLLGGMIEAYGPKLDADGDLVGRNRNPHTFEEGAATPPDELQVVLGGGAQGPAKLSALYRDGRVVVAHIAGEEPSSAKSMSAAQRRAVTSCVKESNVNDPFALLADANGESDPNIGE